MAKNNKQQNKIKAGQYNAEFAEDANAKSTNAAAANAVEKENK